MIATWNQWNGSEINTNSMLLILSEDFMIALPIHMDRNITLLHKIHLATQFLYIQYHENPTKNILLVLSEVKIGNTLTSTD